MARAWIELPPGTGWGDTRTLIGILARLDYYVEEIRGSVHLLRLSGSRLETWALYRVPGDR